MNWVIIDGYDGQGGSLEGKIQSYSYHVNYPTPKPTYHNSGGWALRDDIHEWLIEREPNYKLIWEAGRKMKWSVGIECPQTAMMFKLTWS